MRAETLDKGNQVFYWSKIFMKAFCCKQLLGGCQVFVWSKVTIVGWVVERFVGCLFR